MITLDQIRALDSKVQQAVEEIESLRNENTRLRTNLASYEKKVSELEILIDGFKTDQGEIEEGIQKALLRLDVLSSEPKNSAAKEPPASDSTSVETTASNHSEQNGPPETEQKHVEAENGQHEQSEEEIQPEELDIF